jgi:D-glycero-alpha-D-manno-heptose 1-phosphate guanylyltransferase
MTNRSPATGLRSMPSVLDAIVLCGGAGIRLRSVTAAAPKSLAMIGDRPFLQILLHQLRRHDFRNVILAVGYQRDLIRSHLGNGWNGVAIKYSVETSPLGTGGALRSAVDLVESDAALVVNGDSYTDADLAVFVRDYREAQPDASLLVVPAEGRIDCGLVSVDSEQRVLGFREKESASGSHWVNAGVYVLDKCSLLETPPGVQISLESDLFPRWLAKGKRIRAFLHSGECVDIGTPERYQSAQTILANVEMDEMLGRDSQRA